MPDGRGSGRLVAVVGPSGAGKDTVLGLCRPALAAEPRIRFARRVVTRTAAVDAEDHDCLDEPAFAAREAKGAFCLTWRAHGLSYGLPLDILEDSETGRTVVANLSRRALGAASLRFPELHVVEITAPRALLVERIARRGRESAADIEARLARAVDLEMPAGAHGPHRIDNSGPPHEAADTLLTLLRALVAGPALVS